MSAIMWNQYKKTALFMQIGIALTCIVAFFATGRQWPAVLIFFAVMQLAALLGAAWGASMKYRKERNIQRRAGKLPLENRR